MSSFKDLVKKVNNGQYQTVSASGQKQSSYNDEEEEKKSSSFKDLVKKVNDGTIKVGSKLKDTDVNNWYKSVGQAGKSAYDYLSKDGYKAPNASTLGEIETYLSQAADVGQYIRANRSAFSNYDEVMQKYNDTVNYLRSLQSGLKSSNDFYSKWENQDQYNFWQEHNTVENRQAWYSEQESRLEQLKAERKAENSKWGEVDTIILGAESMEYQTASHEHSQKLKAIDDEIAAIETEMLNYKRGNYNEDGQYYGSKVVDDYYGYSQKEDFGTVSANRDFENATRDELTRHDVLNDSSTWYHDVNGVYRDAFGNELAVDNSGNWVNPKAQSHLVEDRLGMFLNTTEAERQEALGTPVGTEGTWSSILKDGVDGSWDKLDENEIAIYYYLLNSSGQETADKYLSDMKTELNRRETMEANQSYVKSYNEAGMLEKIAFNAATVPAQLVSGVAGTIENVANTLMGNEINPYSAAHSGSHYSGTIRSETAKDINSDGGYIPILTDMTGFTMGDAYQAGMSILDSYAAIGIGGGLGGALLATSAANSEATRLYEQGASMKQIALGSAAAGAAEMVFESLSIDKLINMKDATTVGQAIKNALIQGGIEASEEGFTEIANILTNSIIMGNQSDWAKLVEANGGGLEGAQQAFMERVRDVVKASIGGFISGAGSAGAPSVVSAGANAIGQEVRYTNAGNAIKEYGGVDALMELANEVSGVSDKSVQKSLQKQTGKVAKNATARQVGKLYETVGTAFTAQNKADIVKSLERKNFSSEQANGIADALVARSQGKQLTEEQANHLDFVRNSKAVQDAISNIVENEQSTMGQRNRVLQDFGNEVAFDQTVKQWTKAQEKKNKTQGNVAAEAKKAPKSRYEVSAEGKAIDSEGNTVNIKGIASIEKGKMILETENGTIDAGKVAYATRDQALVYEAVASLGGIIDADSANKLVKKFSAADGVPADVYARGITQAYTYGYYGYSMDEAMGKNAVSSMLTESQRNTAFAFGRVQRKAAAAKAQENRSKYKQAYEESSAIEKKGGVYFRNDSMETSDIDSYLENAGIELKDVQKVSIETMKNLSEALGIEFYVYESYVKDGKRYYIDEDGVEQEGAHNGWYDTKSGKVYIDLHAGAGGRGTMLFTIAHELTHFIHQWSPEKFKKLADIIFTHGRLKGEVASRVAIKMAKAKSRGKPISYEVAYEEVVADSMESILKSGRVMEMVADVKQQDRGLWQKICQWFKDLVDYMKRVVDAYSGKDPDSYEGKAVSSMKDLIKELEAVYADALTDASENYQSFMTMADSTEIRDVASGTLHSDQLVKQIKETNRFSPRDTSSVPTDISDFVDDSLVNKHSNLQMEITVASSQDNKAIHRLGAQYNGHYEGASRTVTSTYIRHIINNHGNPVTEALRGQLYMDGDAIKIALSRLRSGQGRVVGKGESIRGNPTIITEIPINGYTLYVEEPVAQLSGTDLEGRTMFMTPTSTKALIPTKSANIPKRRSEGHKVIIDGKKRIVNNFLADASGNTAEVNYIELNGSPYGGRPTNFLYVMSNDADVLAKYTPNGATVSNGNVSISNPYIVTTQNPIFSAEDLEKGLVLDRIREIKDLGYDAIIMDYMPGDNYMVLAFDKKSIIKRSDRDSSDPDIRYQDREEESVSNRSLLANAFEGLAKDDLERNKMQEYKDKISLVNAEEKKLRELNEQIKELSFAKGPKDTKAIRDLQFEARQTANRISTYDKMLFRLEASKPLQDVLAREKEMVRKREKQKGKEALEAYREKTMKTQQELIEKWQESRKKSMENRQKTEMRKKIRKVIRDLDKILNRGDKKRNVKEDMKNFVAEALASAEVLFTDNYTNEDIIRNGFGVELSKEEDKYLEEARAILTELANLPSGSYEAVLARQEAEEQLKSKLAYRMSKLKDAFFRERQMLNKAELAEVLGKLADAYAKLETSEYSYVNGAYHEAVYEYLKMLQEDVGGAKVKDMTLGQLGELYKAYTMVLTTVQNANKMFADGLKMSKEELANRVMMEVYQAGGEHGLWTKGELARNQASWNNTKPIYAAERTGSPTFVKLVNGLFNGQYGWATDMAEAKAFRQKVADKYGFKNWDMEKLYKFTSSSGIEFELNLNQIMSLYAYAKREQAHDHLLKGGFVFGKNTEVVVTKNGIKRTYLNKSAKAHNISDEIMGEIVGKLTKEQKGFVDEMQDYLSTTMGGKGNEVSMRIYGVKLFMEKFYFPLRSAGQFKEKAKEAELNQQQGQISIVNSGFTKAVTPKASNPVVLDGFTDVWAGHVNEMSLYHSMVLPMEDFRRVYNYASPHMEGQESASVNSFIENAYGDAATGYFDQLYKELNGGAIVDPRENLSKQMIGKFKKSAVMFSNSVWVQQFSAIGRAYALIDPKHFFGAKIDKKRHAELWEEMKKYAPVTIIKEMGGFDTHTGASASDYLLAEEYGKGERFKGFINDDQYRDKIMGLLPAKADELTWCAIWEAVKRETKAMNPKMDAKSYEFLKRAGERFSEVIEKTQVYDSVLARSANMRSKQGLMQMLTAFMAEPTTTVNMIEDALRKGNKKVIARTFGAVAASIILNNALASIIYAMRDDDEDETWWEKYAQAVTSGMLDDINPMTYYPILKDIWSLFQGYDIERSDMAIYSDIADAVKKAVTVVSKYDSEMDDEDAAKYYKQVTDAVMGLLDAGAAAFGVPLKNARRDLKSYYNTYVTLRDDLFGDRDTTRNSFLSAVGGSALDAIPVVGLVAGRSDRDKLYDAIVSGDTTYVNRLKSSYVDDKGNFSHSKYDTAVSKALRDNDPRIKAAAEARFSGDFSKYKEIFLEIKGEGFFSFDNIMRAVNAEVNELEKKAKGNATEETTEADETEGLFKVEHYYNAVVGNDQASAKLIYDDLVSEKVAEGYIRHEAEDAIATGFATQVEKDYKAGEISRSRALQLLEDNTDKDETEVKKWDFELEHGFSWGNRVRKYRIGKLSEEDLISAVIDIEGEDHEAAEAYIDFLDLEKANEDIDITANDADGYFKYAEPVGIDIEVYLDYKHRASQLESDKDKDGKSISGSKKAKVLSVIHSLPITSAQKDALYYAEGWAASKLYEAPWH